jgi:ABC-2 type transport system permease protein
MKKYLDVFRISARNQLAYLPAFLVRNLFFVLVVFIFSALWRAIYAGRDLLAGLSMTQVLWYFTLTEVIELSKTNVYMPIQEEVKDGTIAYTLTRPFSYILYYFSQAMGQNLIKMGPMMIEAFLLATLFSGYLPGYFRAIPAGIVLIVAGFAVVTFWQIIIGLLAFWFEEVAPFYWILQKLIFIIGGMFFPIDLFPAWLQGVSKASPFAFSAYWPAITIVDFSVDKFITCLAGQAFYASLLLLAATGLFRAAVRKVHVQGG